MYIGKLICVLGPTASGKTKLAVAMAKELDGEILSADSRQIYRGMDVGTGKDLADFEDIPYHLIDIADAGTKYNLYMYQRDFWEAYRGVLERGKQPILCGGSGMYLDAVCSGYVLPEVGINQEFRDEMEKLSMEELEQRLRKFGPLHNTTDTCSKKRIIRALEIATYMSEQGESLETYPAIDTIYIGIDPGRELRRQRITARLKHRLEQENMVEEIRGLLASGIPAENLLYYGLEYKFITQYLLGQLTYEEMFSQLEIAIHQFAKRQMTWFRGMERRGIHINWIDGTKPLEQMLQDSLKLCGK